MAFRKFGLSITQPKPVTIERDGDSITVLVPAYEFVLEAGTVRDDHVWDGKDWVPKATWQNKTEGLES